MADTALSILPLKGDVAQDTLSNLSQDTENTYVSYPAARNNNGPYTVLGPVLLPKIYGKDLNAIEVGSSGIVTLSIYDYNAISVDSNVITDMSGAQVTTVEYRAENPDDALTFISGTNKQLIQLDKLLFSETTDDQNLMSTTLVGGIAMSNDVALMNTLSVEGDVFLTSALSVQGETILQSTLSVNDIAYFSSNMYLEGNVFRIPGGVNADRPDWDNFLNNIPQGQLAVDSLSNQALNSNALTNKALAPMASMFYNTEEDKFQGLHKDGVWRNLGGVMDTDSDTYILAEKTANSDDDTLFFVTGETGLVGLDATLRMTLNSNLLDVFVDANLGEELSVYKTVTFNSNLLVKDKVEISSTLSVNSDTYLANKLAVQQATHLRSSLDVDRVTTLKGTLYVSDVATFSNDVFMHSNLSVGDVAYFNSNVMIEGMLVGEGDASFSNNMLIKGNLDVIDIVNFNSNLIVKEKATFSNEIECQSNMSISNELLVEWNVSFGSNLFVDDNTYIGGVLSVEQEVFLHSNLSVHHDVFISRNLSVGGNIDLGPNSILRVNKIMNADPGNRLILDLGQNSGNPTADGTGTLEIKGNLDILGTINYQSTSVTEVRVADKKMKLAVGEDDNTVSNPGLFAIHQDGPLTNHQSGISIEGRPYGIGEDDIRLDPQYSNLDSLHYENLFEKSILWNVSQDADINSGISYLGGLNSFIGVTDSASLGHGATNMQQINRESFWELKGGGLRITSLFKNSSDLIDKVSYGFRISKNRSLEIVKYEWRSTADAVGNVTVNTVIPKILQTLGLSFGSRP